MIDYQVQRLSDAALIRVSKSLKKIAPDTSANLNIIGNNKIQIDEKTSDEEDYVLNSGTYFIHSGTIVSEIAGFSLEFRRGLVHGPQNSGYSNWHVPDSPFVDGLRIEGPNGKYRDKILQIIAKNLELGPPGGKLDRSSSESADAILNRLNESIASAVDHTIQRQRDLDQYRKELEIKNETILAEMKLEFDNMREKEVEKLEGKRIDLESKLRDIDDRSNTHVRRSLQTAMAQLSQDTLSKRLLKQSEISFIIPVAIALFVIVVLSALIAKEIGNVDNLARSISSTINDSTISDAKKPDLIAAINNSILFAQLRVALQAVGVGIITWFVLGMARQRYRQTSRWENDLHRFRLDTERASFLIEGELEARKQNGMVLPEVVLDRFSRGLFSNGVEDRSVESTDVGVTLAHLLNRPAKLRIGPNGIEAEVDKREIRQVIKDINSGDGG